MLSVFYLNKQLEDWYNLLKKNHNKTPNIKLAKHLLEKTEDIKELLERVIPTFIQTNENKPQFEYYMKSLEASKQLITTFKNNLKT